MPLSSDQDPLASAGFNSPHIFDTDMDGLIHGTDMFFDSALAIDAPSRLYGDGVSGISPFQSPMPTKARSLQDGRRGLQTRPAPSLSSESSMQDSSSDSSDQRHRKTSSTSFQSAPSGSDTVMHDASEWNGLQSFSKKEVAHGLPNSDASNLDNFEFSNRAMENDFDFDSAASSPSPLLSVNSAQYTGPRGLTIPYEDSPKASTDLLPHATVHSMGTRDGSPLSTMVTSSFQQPMLAQSRTSLAATQENYIDGTIFDGMGLPTWPFGYQPMLNGMPNGFSGKQPTRNSHHIPTSPQNVVNQEPSNRNAKLSTLIIQPTPQKSRVETQIPIKISLSPMPEGVTKLHLPSHTISKPKLLTKPYPPKSPDMLELYTMLVCTSAMQDPVKLNRALAKAAARSRPERKEEKGKEEAKGKEQEGIEEEGGAERRSSSCDPVITEEEGQPLNGGEVHICAGCITRERKRAARKKSKKPEEEEPWQKDEAKRIVVFNTTEIKEWQAPTTTNGADSQHEGGEGLQEPPIAVPEGAKQIDIPMRIACYCRHQNEKLGFRVILTIKDHQDKLVAQAITDSIVITDDHKTHAPPTTIPPLGSMYADHVQLGGAMFGGEHREHYGPGLYRNAHSSTDLQGLQQSFNHHYVPQSTSPFANPQQASQTTSTTLTPRNMSRQASPSGPGGPKPKKRKGSAGSIKVPDALTMTRLQHTTTPSTSNQAWVNPGPAYAMSSAGTSPFTPAFPPQGRPSPHHTPQRSAQFYHGPSTPQNNDHNLFSATNPPQSFENVSVMPQMYSAPSSARASRAPSPTSGAQMMNAIGPTLPPNITQSTFPSSSTLNPQRPPVIHKLIPSEGPKSGGIEVTCLGSGFHQGLEVMFGDSLATTTTYWGEASLVCLLPPASRAGAVVVTFKHHYQQQMQLSRYPPSGLPKHQTVFNYVDDDEQELLKQALLIMHQKATGRMEDARKVARDIISQSGAGQDSWQGGSSHNGPQRHALALQARLASSLDCETAVLKCLEIIDMDESPFQAQYNLPRVQNGQSLLHMASSLGYRRLVSGLLARGADSDTLDKNGMSPLHMAALNGHTYIVRRLRLAGADAMLRSLSGFTPIDMATSRSVLQALEALPHSRSRSVGTGSSGLHSRAHSSASLASLACRGSAAASLCLGDSSSEDETSLPEMPLNKPTKEQKSAQLWTRSRRNSTVDGSELPPNQMEANPGSMFTAAAMTAWRDQLAAQIQQFQQSVGRTLPHLPSLPPMPNLPDYQAFRRFSQWGPQRSSRGSTSSAHTNDPKDSDPGWWDSLTGGSSPPSYEEIYPAKAQEDLDIKTSSAAMAAADAAADLKCAEEFDGVMRTEGGASSSKTTATSERRVGAGEQGRETFLVPANDIKRLRSDRKLFFIWLPILCFIVVMVLSNKVPIVWHGARKSVGFVYQRAVAGRAV